MSTAQATLIQTISHVHDRLWQYFKESIAAFTWPQSQVQLGFNRAKAVIVEREVLLQPLKMLEVTILRTGLRRHERGLSRNKTELNLGQTAHVNTAFYSQARTHWCLRIIRK